MLIFCLLLYQLPFALVLLSRLCSAPQRIAPLTPLPNTARQAVSVIIPTLNERHRLPHCLEGLRGQGMEEIIIIDSNSQDGTPEYVQELQSTYPVPLRLITDDPLPMDWIGRPWALHNGFSHVNPDSTWVLGLDADTYPQPGLIASIVNTAEEEGWDILSLAPRFIVKHPGEQWLQPALLMTLVYRFGASGDRRQFSADRVMANGQCFLSRRSVLADLGGYKLAQRSFCDDVTLARAAAQKGAKVGFLDGAQVLQVRMYTSMAETWREWGRSLDLKDATSALATSGDCCFLGAVQGLPVLVLAGMLLLPSSHTIMANLLFNINLGLLIIRCLLLLAVRASYTDVGIWYWLSPLADPLAAFRICLSAIQKPKQWRGRFYSQMG